jgi:hypothetical protein
VDCLRLVRFSSSLASAAGSFPRVPVPKSEATFFRNVARLGREPEQASAVVERAHSPVFLKCAGAGRQVGDFADGKSSAASGKTARQVGWQILRNAIITPLTQALRTILPRK